MTAKAAKDANDKAINTKNQSAAAYKKTGVENPESKKRVKKADDFATYHKKEEKEAAALVEKLGKNLGNNVLDAAKKAVEKVEKAKILTNEMNSAKENYKSKQSSYSIATNEFNEEKDRIESLIKTKLDVLKDYIHIIEEAEDFIQGRSQIFCGPRKNEEECNKDKKDAKNYYEIVLKDHTDKRDKLLVELDELKKNKDELIKNQVLVEKAISEAYKLLDQTTKKLKKAMKEKNDAVKAVEVAMK